MNIDAGTAVAIITALVAILGGINSWRNSRIAAEASRIAVEASRTAAKKSEVDRLSCIIDTQGEHITSQDARIDRLEAERDELRSELEATRSRLTEVEAQHDDLCKWVRDKLGYDPIKRRPITQPLGDAP